MVKKSQIVTAPISVPLTSEDWQAQQAVWEGRVRVRGPEGAIFHVGHQPEAFARLTEEQGAVAFRHVDPIMATARAGRIMDYGCGWGRWTNLLAQRYPGWPTVGVDITQSLVEYATAHAQAGTNYRLLNPDGTIPLLTGSVDMIWAWTTLSAILDPRMLAVAIEEWRRVLVPDGLVVLIDNTSKVGGKPVRSPHSVSRTVQEYQQMFRAWVPLSPVGEFVDLGEVNTIFLGRRNRR